MILYFEKEDYYIQLTGGVEVFRKILSGWEEKEDIPDEYFWVSRRKFAQFYDPIRNEDDGIVIRYTIYQKQKKQTNHFNHLLRSVL
jgi:hypothetical protein